MLLFKILFRHSEIKLLKKLFQPFQVLILCLQKAMASVPPDEITVSKKDAPRETFRGFFTRKRR